VDAEHGGLVPAGSAQLGQISRDLREKLSRSADGLEVVEHENGMLSVDLQGRFQSVSVLHLAEDGTAEMKCLEDPEAVQRFLDTSRRPVSAEREVR